MQKMRKSKFGNLGANQKRRHVTYMFLVGGNDFLTPSKLILDKTQVEKYEYRLR